MFDKFKLSKRTASYASKIGLQHLSYRSTGAFNVVLNVSTHFIRPSIAGADTYIAMSSHVLITVCAFHIHSRK